MNSPLSRALVWAANLLWLLACVPGWLAFLRATRGVRQTQCRRLARLLGANAATEIGQRHRFARMRTPADWRQVPLSEYEDYLPFLDRIRGGAASVLTRAPVERLHPTSGSIAATKLVPCTRPLRRELRAAIDPWIASLYLAYPSLLGGRHYWSISPAAAPAPPAGAAPGIGFADDAEYLGAIQRRLARALFAVPPAVSRVAAPDAWEYLTLLFLMREPNLRLVSVWHPSFLTLLIQAIPRHLPAILRDVAAGTIDGGIDLDPKLRRALEARLAPAPARARDLRSIDPATPDFASRIWPRLRVISCWTEGRSEAAAAELARRFPRAVIQGKGLTATEGIVSFPLGRTGRTVCAIRSHYFEFIDTGTEQVRNAWELEDGRMYAVVLTTGGGLYRYRLHDVVRVTGFFREAPCLAFAGRDNLVSDLVGEKLNAWHVEACIRSVEEELGLRFPLAMLAPAPDAAAPGYVLYLQAPAGASPDHVRTAAGLESRLRANFHYDQARRLGQLRPLRVFRLADGAVAIYREVLRRRGMKAGDIKLTPLSADAAWATSLPGGFVA